MRDLNTPFLRFLLVGVANTLVGYGAILLLQAQVGLAPAWANAWGYLLGMLLSYVLNRQFAFRSRRSHRTGIPAFALTAGACFLLNQGILQFAIHSWKLNPALAQLVAIFTYTVAFYLTCRALVFKDDAIAVETQDEHTAPK